MFPQGSQLEILSVYPQVTENLAALSVIPKLTGEVKERIDAIFPPPKPIKTYR